MLRTLGATVSANNCATARLGQSRTSEKILEIVRQSGTTDKKLLLHCFGYYFNHQHNTLCNAIAIGLGKRIGDALQDNLPSFAPHLQISGELMNVHRWVIIHCCWCTHTHSYILHYHCQCDRLIDKEINDTCNDFKGHGEQCHVFCERYFPGRVKIPITRVLGGDRFDVVFEACVGNFWKRKEIMQWLMLVLPLPKNDNIMQMALS